MELALRTNLLGSDDGVRERLRAYHAAGVTTLRARLHGATLSERVRGLERLLALVGEVDGGAG